MELTGCSETSPQNSDARGITQKKEYIFYNSLFGWNSLTMGLIGMQCVSSRLVAPCSNAPLPAIQWLCTAAYIDMLINCLVLWSASRGLRTAATHSKTVDVAQVGSLSVPSRRDFSNWSYLSRGTECRTTTRGANWNLCKHVVGCNLYETVEQEVDFKDCFFRHFPSSRRVVLCTVWRPVYS
jgi:hypothetical protein